MPGRKASATARWTRSVSAALHTPGRWVLALTTIDSAMARSAAGVHVDVAVAGAVEHVGHGGVLQHRGDQRRPAAGDEAVDEATQAHELHRRLVRGVLHQAHRVVRQAGLDGGPPQERRRWPGWRPRADRRPPQEGGVARLEAQPGGVAGDVGPVLVDDADHPERHPHPGHPQPVGAHPALDHLTDRIGQPGHAAQARRPSTAPGPRSGGGGPGRRPPCRWPRPAPGRPGWPRPADPTRSSSRSAATNSASLRTATEERATAREASRTWRRPAVSRAGGIAPGQRTSTRSSRWTTSVRHVLGQLDRCGGRPTPTTGPPPGAPGPWRRPRRRGRRSRPRRRERTRPRPRPRRPAAASGRRSTRARSGPGVDHQACPRPRGRRRSTACGPAAGPGGAGSRCPRRARPGHGGQDHARAGRRRR